jgi:hypothetical protein
MSGISSWKNLFPSSDFASIIDKLKSSQARHWWLIPVILGTQEAESRRIAV